MSMDNTVKDSKSVASRANLVEAQEGVEKFSQSDQEMLVKISRALKAGGVLYSEHGSTLNEKDRRLDYLPHNSVSNKAISPVRFTIRSDLIYLIFPYLINQQVV